MALDLKKVANVLDMVAERLEIAEQEKTSSVRAQRTATVDKLAERYVAATGQELPANTRKKLAEADTDIVAMVNGMIEKQAETVDSMGGPSTRDDEQSTPTTKKEAAEAAEARLLNWVNS